MAAPTPVSAYLHAAAMVKAGIYLIALLAPFYGDAAPWRPIVIVFGGITMLLGALQALRETDLKRLLAFGTVSQLGMLTVVLGSACGHRLRGARAPAQPRVVQVGALPRRRRHRPPARNARPSRAQRARPSGARAGRGRRRLRGLDARRLPAPRLRCQGGRPRGALQRSERGIGVGNGGLRRRRRRFGAHGGLRHPLPLGRLRHEEDRRGRAGAHRLACSPGRLPRRSRPPGAPDPRRRIGAPWLDIALAPYADDAPPATPGIPPPAYPYDLELWHGLGVELWVSIGTFVVGAAVFWLARRLRWDERRRILPFTAAGVYNAILRGIARAAVFTTSITQRGSLPLYVAIILIVFVGAEGRRSSRAPTGARSWTRGSRRRSSSSRPS